MNRIYYNLLFLIFLLVIDRFNLSEPLSSILVGISAYIVAAFAFGFDFRYIAGVICVAFGILLLGLAVYLGTYSGFNNYSVLKMNSELPFNIEKMVAGFYVLSTIGILILIYVFIRKWF